LRFAGAFANVLNIGGLLVLAGVRGGIRRLCRFGDPLPGYEEAVVILAGVLSLLLIHRPKTYGGRQPRA